MSDKFCFCLLIVVVRSRVLFLDTDQIPGEQSIKELDAIRIMTKAFFECGVPNEIVLVVCMHRAQAKLLQKGRSKVEVLTAGRSLIGRDTECMIVSLLPPPNIEQTSRGWEKYWRALNTAFTRVRGKLILVGSHGTMKTCRLATPFLGLVDQNKWTFTLPKDALTTSNKRGGPSSLTNPRASKARAVVGSQTAVKAIGSVTRDIIADIGFE